LTKKAGLPISSNQERVPVWFAIINRGGNIERFKKIIYES
jgi:hypothetical protein